MNFSRQEVKVIAALLAIVLCAYIGWPFLMEYWLRGALPETIEVTDTIFIDGESHFREGCGIGAFKLESQTLKRIQMEGLAAFQNATQTKSDKNLKYGIWSETPYAVTGDGLTVEDRWLRGVSCTINLPPEINQALNHALSNPGSYYSKSNESGVFVIPKFNLVLYMYNG